MSVLRRLLQKARADNPASGLSEEAQAKLLKEGGTLVQQVHTMVEEELIIKPASEKIQALSDEVSEVSEEPEATS